MRTLLVSALALGAMGSAALAAEPLALTDAQLDAVTAGQLSANVSSTSDNNLSLAAEEIEASGLSLEFSSSSRVEADLEFTGETASGGGGGG